MTLLTILIHRAYSVSTCQWMVISSAFDNVKIFAIALVSMTMAITAGSAPLHITSSRTRTRNRGSRVQATNH